MEILKADDRIKVIAKQLPARIGQTGTVLTTYQYGDMDLQYKVRIDNGPICILKHENMEAI